MDIERLMFHCEVAIQLEVEDDQPITCKELLPLLEELWDLRKENTKLKHLIEINTSGDLE